MAKQLEDLLDEQFSKMTQEEKLEFIRSVRKSRRTPKATSKVVKLAKRSAAKQADKVKSVIDNLSPADKAKLIKELMNGN